MRKYSNILVGKTLSVLPAFFVAAGIMFPFYISSAAKLPAPSPADENNLLDIDACSNFSKDNSVTKNYKYVLGGNESQISATTYPGLAKCLQKLDRNTSLPKAVHAVQEDNDDSLMINNIPQTKYLSELAGKIAEITPDKNDQARIAASIVQGFEYEKKDPDDYDYPYDVAYDQKGICNETSKLLINILKQLGFGTAMFTFEEDNHQAVGIKCDPKYSYQNTGYCYIETTTRAIITDDTDEKTPVRANKISDGLTFDALKDYQDTQKYTALLSKKKKGLAPEEQNSLDSLKKEYGLGEKYSQET